MTLNNATGAFLVLAGALSLAAAVVTYRRTRRRMHRVLAYEVSAATPSIGQVLAGSHEESAVDVYLFLSATQGPLAAEWWFKECIQKQQ